MFTLHDFWAGVLLPAVVTVVVLSSGWRATRRSQGARDSRSAFAPLALGLGFAAGWLALFGRPEFPPLDSTDWLLYLTLPLIVAGMLHSYWRWIGPIGLGLVALLPFTFWLVARPVLSNAGGEFGWIAFCFVSLLGIGWVLAMDPLAERISARRIGLLLLVVMGPASVALLLGHSQRMMQIAGLLVAAQAGALAVTFVLGSAGMARGSMLLVGTLYGGILLSGELYAGLGAGNALLLYVAPLMAWCVQPWERRWGQTRTTLAQIGLVAIPIAIVLTRLAIKFAARYDEY